MNIEQDLQGLRGKGNLILRHVCSTFMFYDARKKRQPESKCRQSHVLSVNMLMRIARSGAKVWLASPCQRML